MLSQIAFCKLNTQNRIVFLNCPRLLKIELDLLFDTVTSVDISPFKKIESDTGV